MKYFLLLFYETIKYRASDLIFLLYISYNNYIYCCNTSFVIILSHGDIVCFPSESNLKFYYDVEIANNCSNASSFFSFAKP